MNGMPSVVEKNKEAIDEIVSKVQNGEAEIEGINTGMGKKVTLMLRECGKFTFQYGVGAGTIYSLPDGDKQLEQFVKSFT